MIVEFHIHWASYSNDDLFDEDDDDKPLPPDEGWYIDGTLPDETEFTLGPDHFGPGVQSLDVCLEMIKKWCQDRGLEISMDLLAVDITAIKKVD